MKSLFYQLEQNGGQSKRTKKGKVLSSVVVPIPWAFELTSKWSLGHSCSFRQRARQASCKQLLGGLLQWMKNSTFGTQLSHSGKDTIQKAAGDPSSPLKVESGKAYVFLKVSVLREIQRAKHQNRSFSRLNRMGCRAKEQRRVKLSPALL